MPQRQSMTYETIRAKRRFNAAFRKVISRAGVISPAHPVKIIARISYAETPPTPPHTAWLQISGGEKNSARGPFLKIHIDFFSCRAALN